MKKTIAIIGALFLIGCSTEKQPTCICHSAQYRHSGEFGTLFFLQDVEIDCNTGKPINDVPNAKFLKCFDSSEKGE